MSKRKRTLALLLAALLLLGTKPVPTAYAVDNADNLPAATAGPAEETPPPEDSPEPCPQEEVEPVIVDPEDAGQSAANEPRAVYSNGEIAPIYFQYGAMAGPLMAWATIPSAPIPASWPGSKLLPPIPNTVSTPGGAAETSVWTAAPKTSPWTITAM